MSDFILPRGYLSASAISTLLRCPKQYEFRYIYDYVSPPSAALVIGKAVHSTYEKYFEDALVSSGPRLTKAQVAELSAECLKQELIDSDLNLQTSEYDDTILDIQDITTSYVDFVGKDITPVSVESKFSYITQCGVELMGYLDLEFKLNEEETGLADYKVTSKKWALNRLANSLQFNLYSLATGTKTIEVHNMVKGEKTKAMAIKTPEPGVTDYSNKLRILSHVFEGSDSLHFEDLVEAAARLITTGIFVPCDPEAWCCSKEWCGYWDKCRGKLT